MTSDPFAPSKKLMGYGIEQENNKDYFKKFRNKSFYCQDYSDHYYPITETDAKQFKNSECCTQHMMGLPRKDGNLHPFYDFQEKLLQLEKQYRNLIDIKATGIGDSELKLRNKAHEAVINDKYKNGQGVIFTGPRIELAETLIDRMKKFFPDYKFKTKKTLVNINGASFEAYPSHHLATARGLPNVFWMFLDEFDFFPPGEQDEAVAIMERYMAKGNPLTNGVSTPNVPGGMLENSEKDERNTIIRFKVDENYKNLELIYEREVKNPLYCVIKLPYQIGMGRIYDITEMERAKRAPSFPREYGLRYGYGIGNIFPYYLLDKCTEDYDLTITHGQKILCIDPAYGSSMFGIVGFEKSSNMTYIKEAIQFERPSPAAMLEKVANMAPDYGNYVLVDSAHPGLVRDLIDKGVNAMSVKFNAELSNMVTESSQAVKELRVRIHPAFTDLLSQLRSVKFDDKGKPDKKELTFDLGDAFIMGMNYLKTSSVKIIKV